MYTYVSICMCLAVFLSACPSVCGARTFESVKQIIRRKDTQQAGVSDCIILAQATSTTQLSIKMYMVLYATPLCTTICDLILI